MRSIRGGECRRRHAHARGALAIAHDSTHLKRFDCVFALAPGSGRICSRHALAA